MSKTRILAFAGSNRNDSVNGRLLDIACEMASEAGAEVDRIHLSNYELPLFDQDLESSAGEPANAAKLKDHFMASSGLLLACPEYNSSITPLLKNTIDWVSRKSGTESPLAAFRGKTACLISASPGALGGLRGLRHVREILSNIGVLVTPGQFALNQAFDAFDESGNLKDEARKSQLQDCIDQFISTASRLENN